MWFARASLSLSLCVRVVFVSPHKSRFISIEADLSIYLFIHRATMEEEEEEESVQDLLNGVQLIGRLDTKSFHVESRDGEEIGPELERSGYQIVCFDEQT